MCLDKNEAEEVIEEVEAQESIEDVLASKDAEIARLNEQLKRVTADTENYRKRIDASVERRLEGAREEIFRQLLTIIDHLEMAVGAAQKGGTLESLQKGVELVLKDAIKFMEGYKVLPIESMGQPFDPSCHEAVMVEERDDLPDETVSMELKKGYTIEGRVLRPSMVRVARNAQ